MRNQITKDKEFYIISRSIDNASKCTVVELLEDCFKVKLNSSKKYENGESVELFTMTDKGQLYFETIVKDVQNDILCIWLPIAFKYLQRREYSRTNIDEKIILSNDMNNRIEAKIIDISAGGLKILTSNQLQLLENYDILISIENKEIKTKFEPIRIETSSNGFISSGRFNEISNYDRIALVQYCFRKQIENNNK